MSAETTNTAPSLSAESTVAPVILAVAFGHFLNDLMQAITPAAYPLLKENLSLSFTQVGLITMVFQGTSSLLQPLIGYFTDRRPISHAILAGMAASGCGIFMISMATSFGFLLFSAALLGVGSAVFHPEAARMVRLAAGRKPGFAQAIFQVGGNAGSAFGPLAAAFIVLERGQGSIGWFAVLALASVILFYFVAQWYASEGMRRASARRSRARSGAATPARTVRLGMCLLILLMISKFIYSVSYSSYYSFFLIEKFGLSKSEANMCLFIFLSAVATGTILGGPIGDRLGRRRVIFGSIFGILPLTLVLPWLPLVPNVIVAALAGMILASAFPAMVVYAQDLMPQYTGMVAGLLFGLAFGIAAIGAALLGALADQIGIVRVYQLCAFLPLLGLAGYFLPDVRD